MLKVSLEMFNVEIKRRNKASGVAVKEPVWDLAGIYRDNRYVLIYLSYCPIRYHFGMLSATYRYIARGP
jgi:hypothetical protein